MLEYLLRKLAVYTGIRRCMNCGRWFRRKHGVFCSDQCYDYVMLDQDDYDEWYE